jgi:hypothetical protein
MPQQPADAQPAPPVPEAPPPPLPDVRFTGGGEDPRVLAGLRARRDILAEQLERVGERRGELVEQLKGTSFAEGGIRKGIEARLSVLDERVVQLERDIVATDRQLAGAPPQLLASQTEEPRVVQDGPDEDDVIGVGAGGFLLGLLVMVVGRRIRRWRRGGERGGQREAAAATGPDPRIERLAHAVDAIAVEVERIGEGQRFVTQLLAESRTRQPELAAAEVTTQSVPGTGR